MNIFSVMFMCTFILFMYSYCYLLLYMFCSLYSVSSCWCVNVLCTAVTGYQLIQQIYHIIIFLIKTDTLTYDHHHNHHQKAENHLDCNFLCIGPQFFLSRLTILLTTGMYSHINSGRRVPFFLNKCYPLTSITHKNVIYIVNVQLFSNLFICYIMHIPQLTSKIQKLLSRFFFYAVLVYPSSRTHTNVRS